MVIIILYNIGKIDFFDTGRYYGHYNTVQHRQNRLFRHRDEQGIISMYKTGKVDFLDTETCYMLNNHWPSHYKHVQDWKSRLSRHREVLMGPKKSMKLAYTIFSIQILNYIYRRHKFHTSFQLTRGMWCVVGEINICLHYIPHQLIIPVDNELINMFNDRKPASLQSYNTCLACGTQYTNELCREQDKSPLG